MKTINYLSLYIHFLLTLGVVCVVLLSTLENAVFQFTLECTMPQRVNHCSSAEMKTTDNKQIFVKVLPLNEKATPPSLLPTLPTVSKSDKVSSTHLWDRIIKFLTFIFSRLFWATPCSWDFVHGMLFSHKSGPVFKYHQRSNFLSLLIRTIHPVLSLQLYNTTMQFTAQSVQSLQCCRRTCLLSVAATSMSSAPVRRLQLHQNIFCQ